jgi:hypothetical protein
MSGGIEWAGSGIERTRWGIKHADAVAIQTMSGIERAGSGIERAGGGVEQTTTVVEGVEKSVPRFYAQKTRGNKTMKLEESLMKIVVKVNDIVELSKRFHFLWGVSERVRDVRTPNRVTEMARVQLPNERNKTSNVNLARGSIGRHTRWWPRVELRTPLNKS